MDGMEEFRQIFFTECAELLADMEERLLKLEVGVYDQDQLNAIFRSAHSIKGGSGAFGLDAITRFTHTLEALLDIMREGAVLPTREAIDLLLKSADIVTNMIDFEKRQQAMPADFGAEVAAALQQLAQNTQPLAIAPRPSPLPAAVALPPAELTCYRIAFTPHSGMFASGNEPILLFSELGKLGELEVTADTTRVPPLDKIDPGECYIGWNMLLKTRKSEADIREIFDFAESHCDLVIAPESEPAIALTAPIEATEKAVVEQPALKQPAIAAAASPSPASSPPSAASAAASGGSIRVDLEKIDRLVNMIGELVITEAMLRAQVRHLSHDQYPGLLRGIDELSAHTRELQEAVMAVRMQPVKSIFSRMPRIVRDTAAQLGKDIQLVLSGENTEVDKTVIEQLSDPLTHMIRNSIDHGIESPDQRAWNDKPLQGTIRLSAGHRSGRIIIEISDDGAGINRARVLSKAQEKGLVAMEANLSDEEIDHLIFAPGFSTAEAVTSVSGRGVGMDVVRRNIESLGGTVKITNMPGKGSIFTVSLPLTLAILDGMIVRAGAEHYIIPIINIIETMRPREADVRHVEGRNDVINVRGEFIPVVYLHRLFNIAGAQQHASNALLVLVEANNAKIGIVVDELIGQQQVVIKSLEANADPVKGVSGATILGDGRVSLILEVEELRQLGMSAPLPGQKQQRKQEAA